MDTFKKFVREKKKNVVLDVFFLVLAVLLLGISQGP